MLNDTYHVVSYDNIVPATSRIHSLRPNWESIEYGTWDEMRIFSNSNKVLSGMAWRKDSSGIETSILVGENGLCLYYSPTNSEEVYPTTHTTNNINAIAKTPKGYKKNSYSHVGDGGHIAMYNNKEGGAIVAIPNLTEDFVSVVWHSGMEKYVALSRDGKLYSYMYEESVYETINIQLLGQISSDSGENGIFYKVIYDSVRNVLIVSTKNNSAFKYSVSNVGGVHKASFAWDFNDMIFVDELKSFVSVTENDSQERFTVVILNTTNLSNILRVESINDRPISSPVNFKITYDHVGKRFILCGNENKVGIMKIGGL